MVMQNKPLKQERYTFEDTITNQQRMLMFIRSKIFGKPYFVNAKEQYDFYKLSCYCYLSQGTFSTVVPSIVIDGKPIRLGSDIHHFTNKMIFGVTSENTTLTHQGKKYVVPSVELWKALLGYCSEIFPRAVSESLKMSKEIPRGTTSTLGYDFSSAKKIEE